MMGGGAQFGGQYGGMMGGHAAPGQYGGQYGGVGRGGMMGGCGQFGGQYGGMMGGQYGGMMDGHGMMGHGSGSFTRRNGCVPPSRQQHTAPSQGSGGAGGVQSEPSLPTAGSGTSARTPNAGKAMGDPRMNELGRQAYLRSTVEDTAASQPAAPRQQAHRAGGQHEDADEPVDEHTHVDEHVAMDEHTHDLELQVAKLEGKVELMQAQLMHTEAMRKQVTKENELLRANMSMREAQGELERGCVKLLRACRSREDVDRHVHQHILAS